MNATALDETVSSPLRDGWRARLELVCRRVGARTLLVHDRHEGPLVVQRPFHESNGTCQVYLVHPPGGVAGGDSVELDAKVEARGELLLTAPGATKLYRSAGQASEIRQTLHIEDGGAIEWLPQETIVFDGAHARSVTAVHLAEGARFFGWEIVSLGRPKSGERFQHGRFEQSFELWQGEGPLWLDRGRFEGGERALLEPYALGGNPAFGVAVAYPVTADLADFVRGSDELALTLVDGVLCCRLVCPSARQVRTQLFDLWSRLRAPLLGKPPEPPRIWAT